MYEHASLLQGCKPKVLMGGTHSALLLSAGHVLHALISLIQSGTAAGAGADIAVFILHATTAVCFMLWWELVLFCAMHMRDRLHGWGLAAVGRRRQDKRAACAGTGSFSFLR